jgi:hypothetical protein
VGWTWLAEWHEKKMRFQWTKIFNIENLYKQSKFLLHADQKPTRKKPLKESV